MQHAHVGQTVSCLYCSTVAKKYVLAQAIKAAVSLCSDVFGAVTLGCFLPALSFYMLYISYSNLNQFKAWLALNNPSIILWTRYLVRGLDYQVLFVFCNIQHRVKGQILHFEGVSI